VTTTSAGNLVAIRAQSSSSRVAIPTVRRTKTTPRLCDGLGFRISGPRRSSRFVLCCNKDDRHYNNHETSSEEIRLRRENSELRASLAELSKSLASISAALAEVSRAVQLVANTVDCGGPPRENGVAAAVSIADAPLENSVTQVC